MANEIFSRFIGIRYLHMYAIIHAIETLQYKRISAPSRSVSTVEYLESLKSHVVGINFQTDRKFSNKNTTRNNSLLSLSLFLYVQI